MSQTHYTTVDTNNRAVNSWTDARPKTDPQVASDARAHVHPPAVRWIETTRLYEHGELVADAPPRF